jgi:hypothetical protein
LRLLPAVFIGLSPFGAAIAASPFMYNEFTILPKVMLGACALAAPFYLLFSLENRVALRRSKNENAAGNRAVHKRKKRYTRLLIKRGRSNTVFVRAVICSLVLWGAGVALPFLWKLAWTDLPEVSL